MRKIYPFLLLLLLEMSAYAQNFSLTPVYAIPDSSQMLDYRYGKVLTVKQNGSTATYRLADVATGNTVVIPFTGNTTPIPGNPYGYFFPGVGNPLRCAHTGTGKPPWSFYNGPI